MPEIKLVLTDLDGTMVLPESNVVSLAVQEAIKEAEEKGVEFVAVSGRPLWMAKDLLKKLGFNAPCILEGGAVIINPTTDEIIWSRILPADTTRAAVSILCEHASIIEFGQGVINAKDVDVDSIKEKAFSIWASVPVESSEELISKLRELPLVAVHGNRGPGGDMTRSGVQVTNHEADKEHAVREILRLLDVNEKQTIAIGDGDNDLPLFRAAGLKIAMGNASELLKSQADEVVDSVQNDGFAQAIRQFVL